MAIAQQAPPRTWTPPICRTLPSLELEECELCSGSLESCQILIPSLLNTLHQLGDFSPLGHLLWLPRPRGCGRLGGGGGGGLGSSLSDNTSPSSSDWAGGSSRLSSYLRLSPFWASCLWLLMCFLINWKLSCIHLSFADNFLAGSPLFPSIICQ